MSALSAEHRITPFQIVRFPPSSCPPKLSALSLTKEPSHLVSLKVVGVSKMFHSNNLTLLEDTMFSKHCPKGQRSPTISSHPHQLSFLPHAQYCSLNFPSTPITPSLLYYSS